MPYLNRHQLSDQNWLILALIYMSGSNNVGERILLKVKCAFIRYKEPTDVFRGLYYESKSEDNKFYLL